MSEKIVTFNEKKLLTTNEQWILRNLGEICSRFGIVVAGGSTRQADMAEIVNLIHQLQRMVSSQALARVFPDEYRLLGSTCDEQKKGKGNEGEG